MNDEDSVELYDRDEEAEPLAEVDWVRVCDCVFGADDESEWDVELLVEAEAVMVMDIVWLNESLADLDAVVVRVRRVADTDADLEWDSDQDRLRS